MTLACQPEFPPFHSLCETASPSSPHCAEIFELKHSGYVSCPSSSMASRPTGVRTAITIGIHSSFSRESLYTVLNRSPFAFKHLSPMTNNHLNRSPPTFRHPPNKVLCWVLCRNSFCFDDVGYTTLFLLHCGLTFQLSIIALFSVSLLSLGSLTLACSSHA